VAGALCPVRQPQGLAPSVCGQQTVYRSQPVVSIVVRIDRRVVAVGIGLEARRGSMPLPEQQLAPG
jgi:hypothetical protein